MGLRLAGLGRIVSEAGAESEPFDVGGDDEGEALAFRPAVVAPLRQRNVVIPAVLGKQRLQMLISNA
jgi:hypothetical protein